MPADYYDIVLVKAPICAQCVGRVDPERDVALSATPSPHASFRDTRIDPPWPPPTRHSHRRLGIPPGAWISIDVRDFILRNFTPYTGDAFLPGPGPAARTLTVWQTLQRDFLSVERALRVYDVDIPADVDAFYRTRLHLRRRHRDRGPAGRRCR